MKEGGGGWLLYEWRRRKQLSLLFIFLLLSTTFILWSSWGPNTSFLTTISSSLSPPQQQQQQQMQQLNPDFNSPLMPASAAGEVKKVADDDLSSSPVTSSSINTPPDVNVNVNVNVDINTPSPSSDIQAEDNNKHDDDDDSTTHHDNNNNNTTQILVSDSKQHLLEPKKQDSPAAENQSCTNFGRGKWVRDDTRPLYSGFGCKQWLSSMWACRLTQRTDFEYEKLRWQPKDCQTDDISGPKFLKRMQDKTLAFIGDSLGRQQFQSLMCMITGGEERQDVQDVGKEYGLVKARGSVRPDGWAYRFLVTNTTILYYWSASLCNLEPIDPRNKTTYIAMHLDRPPAFLQRYINRFHVVVLNTGHHWNRGKLNANRWVMYVGGKPNTDRKIADIASAKNLTVHSIVKWVNGELRKYPGLKAFYRSISPRHFFNGDWNSGGTCDSSTPGALEVLQNVSSDSLASGAVKGTDVKLLDITALSEVREEGHISRYSIGATPGMQDCLHWCLPGIPDTWNELLFAQI
ncbi:putative PMR5 domain, PC-Esterase [Helianthus annuus]|uniref:PMR5 domain, PC-Esterase n=1 Tax=Helianthus annuus TaxID=4232 RepID=A0A251TTW9_HELAN|nr:protein trichome birefringence-like 14 isoform X1 [Helianthus annuus]KAF5788658.1 putative PMR5 domain, PC-Esterase [Helianthus annuus]KAJ0540468.1 putative PMR5 domain, PC-Esterase [Helianthus annuus]